MKRVLKLFKRHWKGVDEEEVAEIAEQTQDLNIDLLTEDELEPLPLSMTQLSALQDIMTEKGEE